MSTAEGKKKKAPLPPLKGSPVKPMLPYADVWWRNHLDQTRMSAYKQLEQERQLEIKKVTYNKTEDRVVIEYLTTVPHEWILEELKKRIKQEESGEQEVLQMSMV